MMNIDLKEALMAKAGAVDQLGSELHALAAAKDENGKYVVSMSAGHEMMVIKSFLMTASSKLQKLAGKV